MASSESSESSELRRLRACLMLVAEYVEPANDVRKLKKKLKKAKNRARFFEGVAIELSEESQAGAHGLKYCDICGLVDNDSDYITSECDYCCHNTCRRCIDKCCDTEYL